MSALQVCLSLEPSDEAPLSSPLHAEASERIHRDLQPPELRARPQEGYEGKEMREVCRGAPCGRSLVLDGWQ